MNARRRAMMATEEGRVFLRENEGGAAVHIGIRRDGVMVAACGSDRAAAFVSVRRVRAADCAECLEVARVAAAEPCLICGAAGWHEKGCAAE